MVVISQRRILQVEKDTLVTKKIVFLFTPTVKLFGVEMCVAEMRQVSKISPLKNQMIR